MPDSLRALALRCLRVPHDPEPPAGAPESVRVFRAAENFYKFRLFTWTLTQVAAVAGIVFWISMLGVFERDLDEARVKVERGITLDLTRAKTPPAPSPTTTDTPAKSGKRRSGRERLNEAQLVKYVPTWLFWILRVFEVFGIAAFVVQLPFTLAVMRLDYEMRWYIVTDRSLRIRSGVWRLQELTMSFANIQQVSITRGPIQGLLKICDVRVQSAGGGGSDAHRGHRDNLHTGIFHGVANAEEIRDLILERLRRFRAAGLGDPDDVHESASHQVTPASSSADDTLAAAKELLVEARTLKTALQS